MFYSWVEQRPADLLKSVTDCIETVVKTLKDDGALNSVFCIDYHAMALLKLSCPCVQVSAWSGWQG